MAHTRVPDLGRGGVEVVRNVDPDRARAAPGVPARLDLTHQVLIS